MKLKLVIDEFEIEMGIEFSQGMIDSIPDSKYYTELFDVLAKNGTSQIRRDIAYKDNISKDTAALLLSDKDPSVLDRILSNEVAKSVVSTDQIISSLEAGVEVTSTIIQNIEEYELIDTEEVINTIINKNDFDLLFKLADGYSTPKKFLRKLSKSTDPDIRRAAKNSLD